MKITAPFVDHTNRLLLEKKFDGDPIPNKGELLSVSEDETYEITQKAWSYDEHGALLLYILKRRILD